MEEQYAIEVNFRNILKFMQTKERQQKKKDFFSDETDTRKRMF